MREAISVLSATGDRIDTKARLIGYVVLWSLNARSWAGLSQSENTPRRVRADLLARGVDIWDVYDDPA